MIPEPDDQKGHRKRRGSRGGRPVGLDAADYRNRNVIERGYCRIKQWRGLATRYDKLRRYLPRRRRPQHRHRMDHAFVRHALGPVPKWEAIPICISPRSSGRSLTLPGLYTPCTLPNVSAEMYRPFSPSPSRSTVVVTSATVV